MIQRLVLENFASAKGMAPTNFAAPTAQEPENLPPVATADEEAALAAFEQGYKSGWDDCAAADAEAQKHIAADLASNLRDVSMTYAEARRDVLQSLGPLLEDIAAKFLPTLAAEAIAPSVIEQLQSIAASGVVDTITILGAPPTIPVLEELAASREDLSVIVLAEPSYAEGQVSLQCGAERRKVDLTDAANRMAQEIRMFVAEQLNPASDQKPEFLASGAI